LFSAILGKELSGPIFLVEEEEELSEIYEEI
jgi:hypothetical protein